jgi:predicted DNA-binding transcriptional regulator AlpA
MAAAEKIEMLNISELMAALKVSRTAFYRLRETTTFPKPIKVGGSKRWITTEVIAWQNGQRRSR